VPVPVAPAHFPPSSGSGPPSSGSGPHPDTPPEDGKSAGDEPPAASNLKPRRYELAGFPIIGGNSDIGIQFGGAATYTRFYDEAFPYLWNIDLLLSASIKNDTEGFRLVQQSHVLRFDAPQLWGGKLRIDTRGSFQRTINAGYYGVGDATTAGLLPGQTGIGQSYQYTQLEGRIRSIGRIHTGTPFDLALGANMRIESPTAYAGSRLAGDLAARDAAGRTILPGGQTAALGGIALGVIVDTRDSEFITRRGFFYQAGIGWTVGSAEDVKYAEMAVVLAHYAPLGGPFIFANRFVASFQVGRPAFYDLQQGGVFEPQYLFGGEQGVRGVPNGRYAGKVKLVSNTEIRATPFPRFTLLGQRLLIGTEAFFDAGRVWSDYATISAADGDNVNLKFGVGGGLFLQWGEAAIFRIEAAFSPDAVSENPGFPLGLYVSDGLMF
jgi:outer membrane protein assembly factor BamA